MNILGIGVVFNRGYGIDCFENALKQGWQEPYYEEISYINNKRKRPVYKVNPNIFKGKSLLKKARRSDKFSKMAILAASEALNNSKIEGIDKTRLGIIVTSAFGPHVTTFNVLDHILDYGEVNISPTTFSNSVHNGAASYVAEVLGIRGPGLTVTNFHFSLHYALQLARLWLDEQRCDYILTGAVDECGHVLMYIYEHKLHFAEDGRIKPFVFNPSYCVPGEGAVFFLLSKREEPGIFCTIDDIVINDESMYRPAPDLTIIESNAMIIDESVYMSCLSSDTPTAAYSPVFGTMMTGTAFNCAAGALMLKNQICYANPVKDNPHSLNIIMSTKRANLNLLYFITYDCYNNKSLLIIKKR